MAAPKHTWDFRRRLRARAFGWRGSRAAIAAIDAALAEIRAARRQDPVLAAEGAVVFLEKISSALEHVDSSSGALGNATWSAIEELVPVIAQAPADAKLRRKWLERLFQAYQDDAIPYIESLGDHWGTLCATPEVASAWADELIGLTRHVLERRRAGEFGHFKGQMCCLSALFAAGRYDELVALLASQPRMIWHDAIWVARVHVARGEFDAAIAFAEANRGLNDYGIPRFCEETLLAAGRSEEAYARYALVANRGSTHLATFRAIAKRYPGIEPDRILHDLIASTPASPGKWFATAKTLGRYELAAALARQSPCDPRTLIRAARDHAEQRPVFALDCALAALHWIAAGHGYEVDSLDARQAHTYAITCAKAVGREADVASRIAALTTGTLPAAKWLASVLPA